MTRLPGALAALAVVILAGAQTYHYFPWNFDDPYIIFTIVRRLLAGDGWTFNVGEVHNPSTSVLNTVVVAAAAWGASADIPATAHVLGGIWLTGTGLAVAWLFARRFDAWIALLAALALVTLLANNILWGLEHHLVMFLFMLFLVLEQRGRNAWGIIGLLALARPDALLVAVIRGLASVRWTPWPATMREWGAALWAAWRANARGLLIFAAVLAPWVVFSLIQFHQVFPDTLSNKMWQGRSGFWGSGPVYLKGLILHVFAERSFLAAGYVLAIPGLFFLVRDRSVLLYFVGFVALQQCAYVVLNVPGYAWYFATFDSAAVVAAVYATGSLYALAAGRVPGAVRRYAPVALAGLIVVKLGMDVRTALASQSTDLRDQVYQSIAATLVADGIPRGYVAATEVGTFGYYLDGRPVLDLIGLASANPEFITGRNNDLFFRIAPPTVLLHSPIWHHEKAIFEDVRFRMMYGAPVVFPHPLLGMQSFRLKPGARTPTPEEITAYVEQQYTRFQLEHAGPLVEAPASEDVLCIVDLVNDVLASQPMQVSPPLLSLSGWAFDKREDTRPGDVYAMLRSESRTYVMKATRVARPDVAAAFKQPRLESAGFTVQGSITDVAPGDYRLRLLQKSGDGFLACDVPPVLSVTAPPR